MGFNLIRQKTKVIDEKGINITSEFSRNTQREINNMKETHQISSNKRIHIVNKRKPMGNQLIYFLPGFSPDRV